MTAAPFPNPAVTVSALQISIMLYGLPRPDGMACGLWYFLSHSALLRVFPRLVCSGCCFPSLFLISPSDQTHPRLNEARGNILQDINFTVQGSNVKETTQAWNEARGNILQDTNFTVQGTECQGNNTSVEWIDHPLEGMGKLRSGKPLVAAFTDTWTLAFLFLSLAKCILAPEYFRLPFTAISLLTVILTPSRSRMASTRIPSFPRVCSMRLFD